MGIYTLYVNNYSVQFSKKDGVISVSLPSFRFSFETKQLPESARTKFMQSGWSDVMINALEKHLVSGDWIKLNCKKLSKHGRFKTYP